MIQGACTMENSAIQQAMTLKSQGKYHEATHILEQHLTSNISGSDSFLISSLVFCYGKTGMHQKIIDISDALRKENISTEQLNIATAWAYYNLHFKDQKILNPEKAIDMIENIGKLFPQTKALHPLPLAIFKYVSSNNVITAAFKAQLLELLKPELLDSEPKQFNGKDQLFSSDREVYYSHYSKALLELGNHARCAEVCQEAFELKLTQRVWFERRYAMCLAKLGRMQEAFELYQKLAAQKGEWYIYFETGLAAFRLQEYQSAEAYAMKAMFAPGKIEAKIHLWELLRDLMSHNKQYELAIELLSLIAAIRQQMHWSVPSGLMQELASYNLVLDQLRPFKDILHSIKYKLKATPSESSKYRGTISKMLPNDVAGFITCSGQSYYFRAMDCKGFQPTVNQKVSFDLIDSFDAKKQQKTLRAIHIKKEA